MARVGLPFVATGILAAMVVTGPRAHAIIATGGSGKYIPNIDWINWGADGDPVGPGKTATSTLDLAGVALVTTCTMNAVSGSPVAAYVSGDWYEDSMPRLYDVGQAATALFNETPGEETTFTFSCSATLGGRPYPLKGLVFADGETTSPAEFTQTTLPAGATMRIIEPYRPDGCTFNYYDTVTGSTYRYEGESGTTSNCEDGNGIDGEPIGINYIEGATTATIVMHPADGYGHQAIALGAMIPTVDGGDAPDSYGDAAHIQNSTWS
ncbi:MAG TPA: CshA/CshB family fibrillar adhesin-related protein, partial [Acidimicrobiales bacterium]